jgi:rRNA small subunit pseudouridine methyltransferase Nep1
MRKTKILFVEASIETVPKKLWKHPAIIADSRRRKRPPKKILLNISLHHKAMVDHNIPLIKRGRPDIIHRTLLLTLDSPLNKEKQIEIYVHTIEDKIIWIHPDTRIPLDYYRFEGLITQLLEKGKVPPDTDKPLIKILNRNLEDIIGIENKVYLLDEKGRQITKEIIRDIIGNIVIIGAFQEGDFRDDILDKADKIISISRYPLHTTTATCILLTKLYQEL